MMVTNRWTSGNRGTSENIGNRHLRMSRCPRPRRAIRPGLGSTSMAATYQTVTTGDCRQLEYLGGGSAGGRALLFHVGTPNCATEFSIFREPAEELGLR